MTLPGAVVREPTEVELRVAKALCNSQPFCKEREMFPCPWCVAGSRAAIRAMRNPTDEMWEAVSAETAYVSPEAWQAMINAASPPDETGK